MKKLLLLVAIMLCCATAILAQNNRISYQAVVRDTANRLVANKTVTVTVNIFNGTETTAAYSETHTNVQTNYNGLFSLQIGGGTATGVSWDEAVINWKDAKVITAVSLDGTELATLNMPLTAVPYALYADYAEEINPDAVVVTEIYEKMLADSNALAGQITNLDSKLTSKIHEDSVALAGQITTLNTNLTSKIYEDSLALAGQINTVNTNLTNKIHQDSVALAGQITNLDSKLTSKIHEDSVALAGQITTLNTNLTSKIYEDSVALAGQITTLNTNLTNEINNLKAADNALSTRIKADSANLKNNYYIKSEINTKFADTAKYALKSSLAEVAFTGSYNSLSNKPDINNATLTINQGSDNLGTFTANASQDVTITIPSVPAQVQANWNQTNASAVDYIKNKPTDLGQFTNNAGYLKCTDECITALQNRITALEQQLAYIISQFSPLVTTDNVSDVNATTASCGGTVTSDGGKPVTARGVCWNTSANPTVSNSKTTDNSGTGDFTSNITGLTSNTIYYVRAYATNCVGTAYGEDKTFTTLATVNTNNVTNVTKNSATCGGSFPTTNGTAEITERGVCWSTSQNPTLGTNNYTSNGTGTGSFTSNITGLSQGTTYYVRAYATNSTGTTYGEQKTFTTPTVPTVTTTEASSITATSATSGGNVTATGGASVTARGVCWSTSENPTLGTNNYTTDDGTGTGSFTSNITGLNPNTTYYVRAYATNSVGTAYGTNQTFTTYATVTTSNVTDVTGTSANCGGSFPEANGSANITARGVCWSTSQNPTISNSKTIDGTGKGDFPSNITGLSAGTTYYVRAYATNSAGTAYGEQKMFTTTVPTYYITVSKGSSPISEDKRFYYSPGETYRQALVNHPENLKDQNPGWGKWEQGTLHTLYYKEGNETKDMYIDGDSNFAPGYSSNGSDAGITLDTQVDPNHTFVFSYTQSEQGGN